MNSDLERDQDHKSEQNVEEVLHEERLSEDLKLKWMSSFHNFYLIRLFMLSKVRRALHEAAFP